MGLFGGDKKEKEINARLRRKHGALVSDDDNPLTQSLSEAQQTRSVFWNNISMQSWNIHKQKRKERLRRRKP